MSDNKNAYHNNATPNLPTLGAHQLNEDRSDVWRQRAEESTGISLKTERDLAVNMPITQCDVSYFYQANGLHSIVPDIDPTSDWDWNTMTEDDKLEMV